MRWFKKAEPRILPAEHLEQRIMPQEHQDSKPLPPLPLHENEPAVEPTPVPDFFETRASSPFNSSDGQQYWTMKEFANGLLRMQPGTFSYHVNEHKNDYVAWIEACFPPEIAKLGQSLRGKNREEMFRIFMHAMLATESHEMASEPVEIAQSEPKVEHIVQDLQAIRLQSRLDLLEAREQFIRVRNKVWQDFDEDERKAVYPALRETYELLVHHD